MPGPGRLKLPGLAIITLIMASKVIKYTSGFLQHPSNHKILDNVYIF